MTITRALATAVLSASFMPAFAQQPAPPAFEVASIKPATPGPSGSSGWHSTPGRLLMNNQTLRSCIRIAYRLQDNQVTGGPNWVDAYRFDLAAKSPGPADDPELLAMLQTLLANRFQLVFHREPREFPGYALVVSKKGIRIPPDEAEGGSTSKSHTGSIAAEHVTMAKLAEILSRQLRYPVVDDTGASGRFTFKLEFAPDRRPDSAASDNDAPDLFAVLERQLGLRLESRKIPGEVLVIDRAEKPAEN